MVINLNSQAGNKGHCRIFYSWVEGLVQYNFTWTSKADLKYNAVSGLYFNALFINIKAK